MTTTPALARPLSRRRFLQSSAATGAFLLSAPAFLRGKNLNEKLNIAIIGSGGRGASNLQSVGGENIVALCDVNENALNSAAKKYPKGGRLVDFRKLYDDVRDMEVVVVRTVECT